MNEIQKGKSMEILKIGNPIQIVAKECIRVKQSAEGYE